MFTWQDGSTYEGFWVQVGAGVGMGDVLGWRGHGWLGLGACQMQLTWGEELMVGLECACECAVLQGTARSCASTRYSLQ